MSEINKSTTINTDDYINKFRSDDLADRYTLFPIEDEKMYEFLKKQEAAFWSSNELDFSRDIEDYNNLNPGLKRVIDYVNCFFASTDGLIIDNIALRFLLECKTLEEQGFYIFQLAIEYVHSETYSLIINTLISDPDERRNMFNAVNNLDCVKHKAEWLDTFMKSDKSEAHRVLVFACGEGILFMSSFLFIFYFREKGILQNIVFANEQISKDENMHKDAGVIRYKRLGKLSDQNAFEIVGKAVELEIEFIDELLPEQVDDLNPEDAKNFVRVLADHLLVSCGHSKLYNVSAKVLPSWINGLAMEQKSNFYEVRVGNYKQSSLKQALDWRGRIKGQQEQLTKALKDPREFDI